MTVVANIERIYYPGWKADLPAIYTVVQAERMLGRKIAVEVGFATTYCEDYHQDYLQEKSFKVVVAIDGPDAEAIDWNASNYNLVKEVLRKQLKSLIVLRKKAATELHLVMLMMKTFEEFM